MSTPFLDFTSHCHASFPPPHVKKPSPSSNADRRDVSFIYDIGTLMCAVQILGLKENIQKAGLEQNITLSTAHLPNQYGVTVVSEITRLSNSANSIIKRSFLTSSEMRRAHTRAICMLNQMYADDAIFDAGICPELLFSSVLFLRFADPAPAAGRLHGTAVEHHPVFHEFTRTAPYERISDAFQDVAVVDEAGPHHNSLAATMVYSLDGRR